MDLFSKILVIAAGGGFGAAIRHMLAGLLEGSLNLPDFAAVMGVNVLGAFLIGFTFLLIEVRFRPEGNSRLKNLPVSRSLESLDGWPEGDPTLPAVDVFQAKQSAELYSGFFITGILGGMTTFSLFSLLTLNLVQSGEIAWAAFNAIGTVILGFAATQLGFRVGCLWALNRSK